jgi:hypothetical protein
LRFRSPTTDSQIEIAGAGSYVTNAIALATH